MTEFDASGADAGPAERARRRWWGRRGADPDDAEFDIDEPGDGVGPAAETAASGRDQAWFDDLFRAHARAVTVYLGRRAAPDDVEDLAAEVMLTAWRRREDVPEGFELPWLYRTAGFVLANHRRKLRPVPVETVPDERDERSDPALAAVADDEIARALAALGERDRQVLLLASWEGLDGEALGRALGLSRGGAAAALSRARARLRAVLEERGDG